MLRPQFKQDLELAYLLRGVRIGPERDGKLRGEILDGYALVVFEFQARGTKRLELEYHERIPVENFTSQFAIPLRPDAYAAQQVGKLKILFELRSQHALKDFQPVGKLYPLQITERTAHLVRGTFNAANFKMDE